MRSLILLETRHRSYPGSRLSPEVDAIIALAIRDTYCLHGWAALDNILLTVAYRIQAVNHTRPMQEQLRLPARSAVYRRVKAAARSNEMNPPGSGQSVQCSVTRKAHKTVDQQRGLISIREEGALIFPGQ